MHSTRELLKRALLAAPFLFACFPQLLAAAACRPAQFDEQVSVRYVYDGDTVFLRDGRKLRLIGINTPERARDEQPAEPHANAARQHLQAMSGKRWSLAYDAERRDRYGRLLAHAFDHEGRNITRRLLASGAGQLLVFPPNLRFVECYRAAQQRARESGHGLWALPHYRELSPAWLNGQHKGAYRVVRGTLTRIGESRSSLWLNLGERFALRIIRGDLGYFDRAAIDGWQQQTLSAQGWVYYRNGQWRMRLRHPAALLERPD